MDDLRLRFKDWVELIPAGLGDQDVNAISSKFFQPKGKTKTLQFTSKKVLELYLELVHEQYADIVARLDIAEMEDNLVCSIYSLVIISTNTDPKQPKKVQKMSITHPSMEASDSEDQKLEDAVSQSNQLLSSLQISERSLFESQHEPVAQKGQLRKRQLSVRFKI